MLSSGFASVLSNTVPFSLYRLDQSVFVNRLFTEAVVLYEQETKRQTHLTINLDINASGAERPTNFQGFLRNNRQNRVRVISGQGQTPSPPTTLTHPNDQSNLGKISNMNDTHGFPLVSSYFQALLELCINLSRVNI